MPKGVACRFRYHDVSLSAYARDYELELDRDEESPGVGVRRYRISRSIRSALNAAKFLPFSRGSDSKRTWEIAADWDALSMKVPAGTTPQVLVSPSACELSS